MEVKCRACLSTTGTKKYYPLSTIFPVCFKTNLTILELLEVVTSTSVCNFAGAPNKICQTCVKHLKDSYRFIIEFKKAQLWLERKCNQQSAISPVKVEEHDNDSDLGENIVIRFDNDKKSLSFVNIKEDRSIVEDDKQDLKDSESLHHTNQSDNDAGTSVIKIKNDDVYVEHNYPKPLEDPNSSIVVRPETIIIKVDPLEIIPNENIIESVRKIKPKARKNDSQKLNRASPNYYTRVPYVFPQKPPAVVCEICKNKFYTERALTVHKEIVHWDIVQMNNIVNKNQSLPQPSEKSKKLSAENNLEQTLVSEERKSVTGSTRVKIVPAKYRTAISRAGKEEDQTFICDICQGVYNSADVLNRHKKRAHQPKKKTFKRKTYICIDCGLQCRTQTEYRKHRLKHKGTQYGCGECTRVYNSLIVLNRHKKQVHQQKKHAFEPKIYVCSECGMQCRTQSEYRNHTVKHKGKQFGCDECTKAYYTTTQLKDHKRLVHGVGLTHKYLCTQCGKKFKFLNGYKYHLATVHTGEKPFMCKFCGYKSFTRGAMTHHERAHTGEKPYECKVCNKKFKNSSTLNEHHFKHRGTPKHNCEYCGKGFNKTWNMKLHWLQHEGEYSCKQCSKSFVDEPVLKFHCSRIHKVEGQEKKDYENVDTLTHSDSELLFAKDLSGENYDLGFD